MRVRYQADADINEIIVAISVRREPGLDFQTAGAAGIRGLADPEVLAAPASAGRLLVTHDQTMMPGHFGEFITRQESPGLIGDSATHGSRGGGGRVDSDLGRHRSRGVVEPNLLPAAVKRNVRRRDHK